MEQRFFCAYNYDGEIEKKSSSGGAFSAITDAWFSAHGDRGVVYGCVLDENLKARHIRANDKADRDRMRGSKYILSDVSGAFKSVENDLKQELFVAFSGTPCQIAGLLSFLKNENVDTDRLLTIDVICNGVGSNDFFNDYISHLEKRYKGHAISCNFRGKSRAGSSTSMEIEFDNGKKYQANSTRFDWFYSLYYKNYITRNVCFNCQFTRIERCADISIADMKRKNGGEDTKYKSLVMVNSPKGMIWFENASEYMAYLDVSLDDIDQPRLYEPSEKPVDYDRFWQIYKEKGYLCAQKYVGNNTLKGKLKSKFAVLVNNLHLAGALKKMYRAIKKSVNK